MPRDDERPSDRPRNPRLARRARPGSQELRAARIASVERLEERTLLAVSSSLSGGTLGVQLGATNDVVALMTTAGKVDVFDGLNHTLYAANLVTAITAAGTSAIGQTVFVEGTLGFAGALNVSKVAKVQVDGQATVGSASLSGLTITINPGASIVAGGNIALTTSDVEMGVSATASASITDNGATLRGANLSLTAGSSASATTTGIFDPNQQANIALVNLGSMAQVSVTGGAVIAATGSVTIAATSSANVSVLLTVKAGGLASLDAGLATSLVTSTATANVSGSATIQAGGAFHLSSTNTVNVTTSVDGTAGGPSALGGTVALAIVGDTTTAGVSGSAAIHAASVGIAATSTDNATTSAKSTAGGASQNDASTQQDLTNYNAKTSSGSVGLSGALAITDLTRQTQATLTSTGAIAGAAGIAVNSSATTGSNTSADGSATAGGNAPGVGVAVAINRVHATNSATLGGSLNLTSSSITANASNPGTDVFSAKATSGAGSSKVGVAGALALNLTSDTATATLAPGSTLVAGGADVGFTAGNVVTDNATATAKSQASGKGIGIGGSVALNLTGAGTSASLGSGSSIVSARNLNLTSNAIHAATTDAEAGATASGQFAGAPAFGIAVVNDPTSALIGPGVTLPNITGGITGTASYLGSAPTTAGSVATASSAAVGVTLALAALTESTTATTASNLSVPGAIQFSATAVGGGTVSAKASAAGGPADSGSGDVDSQATTQRSYADIQAGSNHVGGTTGAAATPSASATDPSSGQSSKISVAAAIAIEIGQETASAIIPAGLTIVAGGPLTLSAAATTTGTATADGSATSTGTGSIAVGAAVAINLVKADAEAVVGYTSAGGPPLTTSVRASGLTLSSTEAGTGTLVDTLGASATAGAGATKVGVAGALALNLASDTHRAQMAAGSTVNAGSGDVVIAASGFVAGGATATATQTQSGSGSAKSVGVGASFAIDVANNTADASIASGASLVGGQGLTLTSTLNDAATTSAMAGAGGSVGVAPGIAIAIINDSSSTTIGSGLAVAISGTFSAMAMATDSSVVTAGSAATGDSAAVGVTLALALVTDSTVSTTARNLTAASAQFTAIATDSSTASATASAMGGSDTSGSTDNTVDKQVASERSSADTTASSSGQKGSGSDAGTPSASGSDSTSGQSTPVSVAAAIAINLAKQTSLASIPDGLAVRATGAVGLTSSLNAAGSATTDATATSTGSGGVAVGAAVSINLVSADAEATVGKNVALAAQSLMLISADTVDPIGTATGTYAASATSGGGATKVGVAGALALNLASDTRVATVGTGATLTLGNGPLFLAASSIVSDTTTATAKVTGAGSKAGVGASFAINILSDTADAELDALAVSGGGATNVASALSHTVTTDAEAGTAAGNVAVAPAVAVAVVNDTTTALLGAGNPLNVLGAVTVAATHQSALTTTTGSAADASGTAAVGVSIGLVIATETTSASTARSLTSAGSVTIASADSSGSDVISTSSSQGVSNASSNTDSQIQAQRGLANNQATANNFKGLAPAPSAQGSEDKGSSQSKSQGGGGTAKVGVAAAIGVNVVSETNSASIGAGLTVRANGGPLSVMAVNDSEASAKGLASSLLSKTAVGATVSLNVATVSNMASVGQGATLAGAGVAVDAFTTLNKADSFLSRAYAAGVGTSNAVAGSVGINVVSVTNEAKVGSGSSISSTAGVDVSASTPVVAENVALAAAISNGSAGVGAAVVVNVFNDTTRAHIDDGSTVAVSGLLNVASSASFGPIPGIYPGDPLDVAIGAGATSGSAGVGGSVVVDVLTFTTIADVGNKVRVNAAGTPPAGSSASIRAADAFGFKTLAGGVGLSGGSAGVGAGVDVIVANQDAEAWLGSGSTLAVDTGLAITSNTSDNISTLSAAGGAGDSAGIAGAISIEVLGLKTIAYVAPNAKVTTSGNVLVEARHGSTIQNIDGQISAGGTAGVGAAVSVVVSTDTTNAYLGSGDQVVAGGGRGTSPTLPGTTNAYGTAIPSFVGVAVLASAAEGLTTFAVGGSLGGTAGVAGSAAVNVLNFTSTAHVDTGATVNASSNTPGTGGSVLVLAVDPTTLLSTAGSLAVGGTAAVGIGADVGVLTKDTEATLTSANVFAGANVVVLAESTEVLTSLSVSATVGGDAAISGSAGIYVVNLTTKATIASSQPAPSTLSAGGSVEVSAEQSLGFRLVTGGLGVSGTASVGASAGVPIITKATQAAIQPYAIVNALGQGGPLMVDDGTFAIAYSAYSTTPGVTSPDSIEGGSGSGYNSTSLTGSKNKTTVNNPRFTQQRNATRHAVPIRGVDVSADNQDDLTLLGVDGGVAGTAAVNITGVVASLTNTTTATIGTGSVVNAPTAGSGPDQSVLVAAGNDTSFLGIAGGFGLSGTVSVTPGVDVLIVKNTTIGLIDDGATVGAVKDIAVVAHATEDLFSLAATASGGGEVAVAASVSVYSLSDTTKASIGNLASFASAGARANAGGSILVNATDLTHAYTIAGSLGVGLGAGGAGAGIGVTSLTKDTEAFLGNDAIVNAGGNLTGSLASVTGSSNRGLTIQATTNEDVFNLAAALAGGLYLGLAGGVSLEIVTSTTLAYVGNYAQVDGNQAGSNAAQSVAIGANNTFTDFSLAGGVALGIAALSGGVDVGIVTNNTSASINPGASVAARSNVGVVTSTLENIQTYGVSASAGAVGLNASVSVWSVGSAYGTTYSQQDNINPSNLMTEAMKADGSGSKASALIGNFAAPANNPAASGANFPTNSISSAQNSVPTSTTQNVVNGKVLAAPSLPAGASALIGSNAIVVAGGSVNVAASDSLTITPIVGAVALGAGVGFGNSASVDLLNQNVIASAGPGSSIVAGQDVAITAQTTSSIPPIVIAGGLGGTVGVAGSVSVINYSPNTQAFVDHNAAVGSQQGNVLVEALHNATVNVIVGQVAVGGGAGVGASASVLSITATTNASIGSGDVVTASGAHGTTSPLAGAADAQGNALPAFSGVAVLATNSGSLTTIAIGGALGGTAGVGGSATVNILNDTTTAQVQYGASVSASGGSGVTVLAADPTTLTSTADELAAGIDAGVGVGVDVGLITKDTEASITSASVNAGGTVAVLGGSNESITSLTAEVALGGAAGVAGSAGVYVVNVTTRAFIGSSQSAPADVEAGGSVLVQAAESTTFREVTGNVSGGGGASVGAAAGVPLITKTTQAYVGPFATINALGHGAAGLAYTGKFAITTNTPYNDSAAGTVDPTQAEGTNISQKNLAGSGPAVTLNSGRLTNQRFATPLRDSIRGVAINAVNRDDLAIYGVDGGIGGGAAVNITGVVATLTNTTTASVAAGSRINTSAAARGGNADQSVLVAAGNDSSELGVAGAVSLAGGAAVTPGVAVVVIKNTVLATIADGTTVDAVRDVAVEAHASEDLFAIAATAAGSLAFSGAGSVVVFSVSDTTKAYIGTSAGSSQAGTAVSAGGSVLVSATDDTTTFAIAGSLGVGLGIAGVGVGVGVTTLNKDTEAYVGPFASVQSSGHSGGLPSVTDLNFAGVSVLASTSEGVTNFAAAGGGGLYVGIGGGVTVEVIQSKTIANVGNNARVSALLSGPGITPSVQVVATNHAADFSFAGGVALGIGAIAGGFDIGVLRNDTSASLGDGSTVNASGDVTVASTSTEDVRTYGISAAGGLLALNGSVSVWSIGTGFSAGYSAGGNSGNPVDNSTLMASASAADSAGSGAMGLIGSFTGTGSNPAAGSPNFPTNRLGAGGAQSAVPSSTASSAVGTSVTGSTVVPSGTVATVGLGASINAGGNVSVAANDTVSRASQVVGGLTIGLGGFGVAVGIIHFQGNTQAAIGNGSTLIAGGFAHVRASYTNINASGLAAAGQGGVVALGGQVSILNDTSTQSASVGDGTRVGKSSDFAVTAAANRNLNAQGVGGGIGGIQGSLSFSKAVEGGSTTATIGQDVQVGQGLDGVVGNMTVAADATNLATASADGLANVGIVSLSGNISEATVNPSITATLGGGSKVALSGSFTDRASSSANANATTSNLSIGAVALSYMQSTATVTPDVRAEVFGSDGSTGTQIAAPGGVTVEAVHDYDAGSLNPLTGQGATATASSPAGGGLLTIGGSIPTAVSSAIVLARVDAGASLSAGSGNLAIEALGYDHATANASSVSYGLLGVGASFSTAHADGSVTASLSGSVTSGGGLTVLARADNGATAMGGSGGDDLLANLTGLDAEATANPRVSSDIGDGSNIRVSGNVSITAPVEAHAVALTESVPGVVSVTLIGIGIMIANADASPTIDAGIGSGSIIVSTGGSIALDSEFDRSNSAAPSSTNPGSYAAFVAAGSGGSNTAFSLSVLTGNGDVATATANPSVRTHVESGSTLSAGLDVSATANTFDNSYAAAYTSTGTVSLSVLSIGVMVATARSDAQTSAIVSGLASLSAGRDLTVAAMTPEATAHADATSSSGGAVITLANVNGSFANAEVNTSDLATISGLGGSTALVNVGRDASVKAGVSTGSTSNASGPGANLALADIGDSSSTATTNPQVNATLGSNLFLSAGGSISIAAIDNDTATSTAAAGFASSVSVSLVNLHGADTTANAAPDVEAHVGAGSSLTAGGPVTIMAATMNQATADVVQASSTFTASAVTVKVTSANVSMGDRTVAQVDPSSPTNPTKISSGGDVNIVAMASNVGSVDAEQGAASVSVGLVSSGETTGTVTLNNPLTLALLGDNAQVRASQGTLRIMATTSDDLQSQANSPAHALNITLVSARNSTATAQVLGGNTDAQVGDGVRVVARNVAILADDAHLAVSASSQAQTGFAADAFNNATSTANLYENAYASLGDNAIIQALQDFSIIAQGESATTYAYAYTSDIGITGNSISTVNSTKTITYDVSTSGTSQITAQSVKVQSIQPLSGGHTYDRIPKVDDNTLVGVVKEVVNTVCNVIGEIVCLWGLLCDPKPTCKDITNTLFSPIDNSQSKSSGSENVSGNVNLNSNIILVGRFNHQLIVGTDGTIQTLTGVTVTDRFGNVLSAGQNVGSGPITVTNVPDQNGDGGSIKVEALGPDPNDTASLIGLGTTMGNANILFDGSDSIQIINNAPVAVHFNGFDAYTSSVMPSITHTGRNGQANWMYSLTPGIQGTVVDLENRASSTGKDLFIDGVINNPTGDTNIANAGGGIFTTGSNDIRTQTAEFVASGSIGAVSSPLALQLNLSSAVGSGLNRASGDLGVFIRVTAGSTGATTGSTLTYAIGNITSSQGNVSLQVEDAQGVGYTPGQTVITLKNGQTYSGQFLSGGFDPATAVNTAAGTITSTFPHGLTDGEEIGYQNGGGVSIGGLTSGRKYKVELISSTVVQIGDTFASASAIDAVNHTITFASPTDFASGDQVVYDTTSRAGLGGASIVGLQPGQTYYVRVISPTVIQLTPSLDAALATSPTFNPGDVDNARGLINTSTANLVTGQALTYTNLSGVAIGELSGTSANPKITPYASGTIFYAVVLGPNQLKLASSFANAIAGNTLSIDGANASGPQSLATAGEAPFAAGTAVDNTAHTLTLPADPGWATGQAVAYHANGGTPIAGLVDGQIYYVVTTGTAGVIQLALTRTDALLAAPITLAIDGTSATGAQSLGVEAIAIAPAGVHDFDPAGSINPTAQSITFDVDPGWTSGQAVVYHAQGGTAIATLADGTTYYAIPLGGGRYQLASSFANATAMTPTPLAIDATGINNLQRFNDASVATGTQSLRMALSLSSTQSGSGMPMPGTTPMPTSGMMHRLVFGGFYFQYVDGSGTHTLAINNDDLASRSNSAPILTLAPIASVVQLGPITATAGSISVQSDNATMPATFEVDAPISAANGTTTIFASGNLTEGASNPIISGTDINLTASTGSIGSALSPIQLALTNPGSGHFSATANSGIQVNQAVGALRVGNVSSGTGLVHVGTLGPGVGGHDLILDNSATVSGGMVELFAGDNFTLASLAVITSSGTTTIFGNDGAGAVLGSMISIAGTIHATTATINGSFTTDTIALTVATAGTRYVVDSLGTVDLGSLAPFSLGKLDPIQGAVTLIGSGLDLLNADDTGSTIPKTGRLTGSTLTGLGLGLGGVTYSGFNRLNLRLGTGANTLAVVVTSPNLPATTNLDGGGNAASKFSATFAGDFVGVLHVTGFPTATSVLIAGNLAGQMSFGSPSTIVLVSVGGSVTSTGVLSGNNLTAMTVGGDLAGMVLMTGNLNALDVVGGTPGFVSAQAIGHVSAGHAVGPVALTIREANLTRKLLLSPAAGGLGATPNPTLRYYYQSILEAAAVPSLAARIIAASANPFDLDLAAFNDDGNGQIASRSAIGKFTLMRLDSTSRALVRAHDIAIEGDLTTVVTAQGLAFLGLPGGTRGGVILPQDTLGDVVARDLMAPGSIQATSIQAVGFGEYYQGGLLGNPVLANQSNGLPPAIHVNDAIAMLVAGTAQVQANTTFVVPFGLYAVTLYMPTLNFGRFDANDVLFFDQFANDPNAAAEGLPTNASVIATVPVAIQPGSKLVFGQNTSIIQGISLVGDGGSIQTAQWVNGPITSTGPVGDLNLRANQGITGDITAERIFGTVQAPYGGITSTIQTTGRRTDPISGAVTSGLADFGRIYVDTTGPRPLLVNTTVSAAGSISGRVISRGQLVSQVTATGNFSGQVAAVGNIGLSHPSLAGVLTRFGGLAVAGSVSGQILSLGDINGDITVGSLLGGRIAAKGSILGKTTVVGTLDSNAAIVAGGRIGDPNAGTSLVLRNVQGIIASGSSTTYGLTVSLANASTFANVAGSADANNQLDIQAIDAIFADASMTPLVGFDATGLDLANLAQISANLAKLRTTTHLGVKVLTDA